MVARRGAPPPTLLCLGFPCTAISHAYADTEQCFIAHAQLCRSRHRTRVRNLLSDHMFLFFSVSLLIPALVRVLGTRSCCLFLCCSAVLATRPPTWRCPPVRAHGSLPTQQHLAHVTDAIPPARRSSGLDGRSFHGTVHPCRHFALLSVTRQCGVRRYSSARRR